MGIRSIQPRNVKQVSNVVNSQRSKLILDKDSLYSTLLLSSETVAFPIISDREFNFKRVPKCFSTLLLKPSV